MDPLEHIRVNPIYAALDDGNPKLALQLSIKQLKKHPNSTHTKTLTMKQVLKAYSLFKLGKLDEAAEICDEVAPDLVNYGEPLLELVARVYRAAGRDLGLIVKLYEQTYRKQTNNIDLGKTWFLKLVTLRDLKNQAQAATMLATSFKTEPFTMWNVYSAKKAGELARKLGEQSIHLMLAERMMQRLRSTDSISNYEHLHLYITVMNTVGKPEQALELLMTPTAEKCVPQPVELLSLRLDAAKSVNDWNLIVKLSREALLEDPNNWTSLSALVEATQNGAATTEDTLAFLEGLNHQVPGPRLAIIALVKESVLASQFLKHFEEQAKKYSCYEDLSSYLTLLSEKERDEFIKGLKNVQETSSTIDNVYRHLNVTKLLATLENAKDASHLPDETTLLNHYTRILPLGVELKETERQYADDYLLLACHSRLAKHGFDNVPSLILMASWLETGLLHSKHNYQFKLLLSRIYFNLGISTRPIKLIDSLNLRTVQCDTLGYLFSEPLDSLFIPEESSQQLMRLSHIYLSNLHETPEMISLAYSNRSLSKVEEFEDFYDRLSNSIMRSLLVVAQRRLDVRKWSGQDVDAYFALWNSKDDDLLTSEHLSLTRDNRDFVAFANFLNGDAKDMEAQSRSWMRRDKGWIKLNAKAHEALLSGEGIDELEKMDGAEWTRAEELAMKSLVASVRSKTDESQMAKIVDIVKELQKDLEEASKNGLTWKTLNIATGLVDALTYPLIVNKKKKKGWQEQLKQVAKSCTLSFTTPELLASTLQVTPQQVYEKYILPDWQSSLERFQKVSSLY